MKSARPRCAGVRGRARRARRPAQALGAPGDQQEVHPEFEAAGGLDLHPGPPDPFRELGSGHGEVLVLPLLNVPDQAELAHHLVHADAGSRGRREDQPAPGPEDPAALPQNWKRITDMLQNGEARRLVHRSVLERQPRRDVASPDHDIPLLRVGSGYVQPPAFLRHGVKAL